MVNISKVQHAQVILIKMKSMMDDEFEIVDYKEGLGQEAGTVIWVYRTKIAVILLFAQWVHVSRWKRNV